jgi:4-alpha-glucanotransferase
VCSTIPAPGAVISTPTAITPDCGAAQSKDSPYFSWYTFSHWPDKYDAWWGISTLPAVNEENPDYRRFIAEDGDSVIRRWLRAGASGWRLDVADELPDDFIALIRQVMDETKPGSVLLGEVWEDGSNKIAYSKRRRYLLGGETHGLMNYPFRTAALEWLRGGDAKRFPSLHGAAAGALSALRLLLLHELSGNPRHPADSDAAWRS